MTRERYTATGRLARLAAVSALAYAVAAQGQVPGSVQDYHLPPATPSPAPTAAGPVDTDHPIAAPTRPAPAPSPSVVLPSPVVTPPAPQPSAAPTARTQRQQPSPPSAAPTVASTAPAPLASPSPTPALEALPSPTAPTPAETAPTQSQATSFLPWAAGGALILVLLTGLLWRRQRQREVSEADTSPVERQAETEPEPSAPAALTPPPSRRDAPAPTPQPAPMPMPMPGPAFAVESRPLEMQLEARHLSRALVNATLAYRLTLTNRAEAALGPLRIAGDITSAHASRPAQELLTPGDGVLTAIHQVPALAPGETVVLSGELRLPLASILPIHSGAARVFVPLARFRVEADDGAEAATRVFVVGQASEQPGGALRPFPLDRGPGVDRALGQHELELPA